MENVKMEINNDNKKNLIKIKNVGSDKDEKNIGDSFDKIKYRGNIMIGIINEGNYSNKIKKRKENDGKTSSKNKK